jgi:hypothetical protein
MAKELVDALVPIFAGLLLGFWAGRRGLMDNFNVRNLHSEHRSIGRKVSYRSYLAPVSFFVEFCGAFQRRSSCRNYHRRQSPYLRSRFKIRNLIRL